MVVPSGGQVVVFKGGGASAGGSVALLLVAAVAALFFYYAYQKPCDLKEHAPKLHKWFFYDSDIEWPKDPTSCPT